MSIMILNNGWTEAAPGGANGSSATYRQTQELYRTATLVTQHLTPAHGVV